MPHTSVLWRTFCTVATVLSAGSALAESCPSPEATGAVALSWVEPLAEPGSFAIGWSTDSQTEVHPRNMPFSGGEFEVVRCLPPGRWVPVGSGEVQGAVGTHVRAHAKGVAPHEERLALLSRSGNLYWRPMIGDFVRPKTLTVKAAPRITPRLALDWSSLFERSGNDEYSLDLSDQGKTRLDELMGKLKGVRGRLAVECYAHRFEPRQSLAEETQVRAGIVAQYLTAAYGLAPGDVVPLGMGALELPSGWREMPKWPAQTPSLGIVVRMIPE